MAASISSLQIGVIAEEYNDVEVLDAITAKLIPASRFKIKPFVAHGCGKLKLKCQKWAQNLFSRGCTVLVVLHDLDTIDARQEPKLRQLLESSIQKTDFRFKTVLIPIEEMEAWLLTDASVLRRVFNMRAIPKIPKNPETIRDPKEFLEGLVERHSNSEYLNTVHNRKIAAALPLTSLNRCRSFSRYPAFVRSAVAQ